MHLWFPQIHILLWKEGRLPFATKGLNLCVRKGTKIVHLWFPRNTHSLMKRRAAPSQPPEIIYFCKFRPKRVWNYAYLACKIIFLGKGAPPLANTYACILTEKGLNLCIYGSPKYTFSHKKKGCPLWPPEIIYFCKFRPKNGLKLCVFSLQIQNFPIGKGTLPPCKPQNRIYV